MEFELRLKGIRKLAYKRLKEGLGTEKNRVVRAILKEARTLLAEVEKMVANYDYAYDFIMESEFALSDILWVNELNEIVVVEATQEVEVVDVFGFEVETIEIEEATQEVVEVEEMPKQRNLNDIIGAYVKKPQEAPQEVLKGEKVVYDPNKAQDLKREINKAIKEYNKAIDLYANGKIDWVDYMEIKKALQYARAKLTRYQVECGTWKSRRCS